MKRAFVSFLVPLLCTYTLDARVVRDRGGSQVAVQNRSANVNRNANLNQTYNRNVNVNQNVNVNRNVNVNNNVNVHGGYYGGCCYHADNDWNWGSFAAGAAVGVATTAAVAAATRPSTTTVVAMPAVGSVITALPGGCSTVATGGAVTYHCSNIYYRPYYQGTSLVYQVVTYP